VTFVLSFGPRLPVYAWLYHAVPLFEGIRGAVRFGQFTLVALAAVAGFGAAWWLARVERRTARIALAAALILGVNVEAWRGPLGYAEFDGIAPLHEALARTPGDAVIAYFPFYAGEHINQNARYMLASTVNWRRMLNGYSGFAPDSFAVHAGALHSFPSPSSLQYLRQAGVTHIVVDTTKYGEEDLATIDRAPDLSPWASDDTFRVFALR
ncbi:MAG TPA: hypothetical protein VK911_10820, partial [Vicinamibacterales bacterium]|nr:hypothetical protein [Vicinamibacterales bacterium]